MSLNPNTGKNKRSSKRFHGQFTIRYKTSGTGDLQPVSAATTDLSVQNLAFKSEQANAIDSKLDIELLMPQHDRSIAIKGTVKRIEKLADGSGYLYGVTFEDINERDGQVLEKYVQLSDINHILRTAVKQNASDIHLVSNKPPILRVNGQLMPLNSFPIPPGDLKEMIFSFLTSKQKESYEKELELDFSYINSEGTRFRGNIHQEKGAIEASFRIIPAEIKSLEELGLPLVVNDLAKRKTGFILITGPSGSGKSTTLTTIIDAINQQRKCMIISIEDPIEYVHVSKKSIIKQREVNTDTLSFNQALKHVLRQDPDVILVGEMRDTESITMAITAAETGHLILSTLSTPDAVESINRIIDAYPEKQQTQIRNQLSGCLEAVICQFLIPKTDGSGRVLATEVLIITPAIRHLIQTGQLNQIRAYMEAGGIHGMHTMDDSLITLAIKGIITKETALSYARDTRRIDNALS